MSSKFKTWNADRISGGSYCGVAITNNKELRERLAEARTASAKRGLFNREASIKIKGFQVQYIANEVRFVSERWGRFVMRVRNSAETIYQDIYSDETAQE